MEISICHIEIWWTPLKTMILVIMSSKRTHDSRVPPEVMYLKEPCIIPVVCLPKMLNYHPVLGNIRQTKTKGHSPPKLVTECNETKQANTTNYIWIRKTKLLWRILIGKFVKWSWGKKAISLQTIENILTFL
jgi:hypothetical protein